MGDEEVPAINAAQDENVSFINATTDEILYLEHPYLKIIINTVKN